ncbi:hypothetical protein LguiA_006808 [Lonicera macranthoides]
MQVARELMDFSTKILDFALVKRGPEIEEMCISIRVIGTYDYVAPELVYDHVNTVSVLRIRSNTNMTSLVYKPTNSIQLLNHAQPATLTDTYIWRSCDRRQMATAAA